MTHDAEALEKVARALSLLRHGDETLWAGYWIDAETALSAMPPQEDAFKAGQFAAADAISKEKWNDGCPNHVYGSEWFIAKLDNGKKVVLRELYKGHSYDYTTADDTYYAEFRIKSWMQFPDSEFVPYVAPQEVSVQDAARVLHDWLNSEMPNARMVVALFDGLTKTAGDDFTKMSAALRALSQQPIQGENK